ncbi:amidohydrolase family protein [Hydrotalea sp.]|uniref:amidohydrolase family protein n=1 Tax=Hydrotalea sp. TaxID=2881279 RepID=UPI002585A3CE|nr:amidohydrolase family protein [Hydrotalea sp.]
MKNIKITLILAALFLMNAAAFAQDDVLPAKPYMGWLFITNGTVHVGNGSVIDKATIEVNNGKIVAIHTTEVTIPADAKKVDATGKQVYPGLILSNTDLGLKEIANGVRGSNDYLELGDLNPNVRSIVAYNTDSKIINTLKANGILLASVTPEGGSISGSSSVVQLDAWNWEDAAYKMDNNIHMNMPSFIRRPGRRFGAVNPVNMTDPAKAAYEKIEELKNFFRQAKAYLAESKHAQTNLKFEAVKGLFNQSKHLFVHADQVKQMLAAIDFAKEFGFKVTIVGASDSYQIADLLKANDISVILNQEHALPTTEDDDVDQPYKTPGELQKAGVLFALNDAFDEARYRNLMFNAGTAATYGLTKEQALQAITLNSAKILGIDDKTGSIEAGKDANIVVSDGDILDMHSSIIRHAFIEGREVSLENKQTELNRKYLTKYGLTQ